MMATTLQLPVIQVFSVTSDQMTLGQRCSKWVKGWEYFLIASNITEKKQKHAVLSGRFPDAEACFSFFKASNSFRNFILWPITGIRDSDALSVTHRSASPSI